MNIYRDIGRANDAFKKLEQNRFKCNFFTLKALLDHYVSMGDLVNVVNTFQAFKDNSIGYLNRHVMEAIIGLATNADRFEHRMLLQFLHSDEPEFKRAILYAIPKLVEHNQAMLVPDIIGAIHHNIDASVTRLFTEMARWGCNAEVYHHIWTKLDDMGFSIRSNLNAYKPALKGHSAELIKLILVEMHSSRDHHLQESCFEQLLKLACIDGLNELTEAINLMCGTYNVRPRLAFICDHIMPLLRKDLCYTKAVNVLCSTRIRAVDAIVAGTIGALSENDMSTAYYIASGKQVYLANDCIIRPLQKAYVSTKDTRRFVDFVCLITSRISKEYAFYLNTKETQATESTIADQRDRFVAKIIETTVLAQRSNTVENISLLDGFWHAGLNISDKQADNIRRRLKVKARSPIDTLLMKLSKTNADQQSTQPNIGE